MTGSPANGAGAMPPRLCQVCDAPARAVYRVPPPELAPDLDLRPGEPARSTLPHWVQTCRRCGASGPDLAALPPGAGNTVRSDAYRALRTPGAANPFLRWARIARDAGLHGDAAEATLQAAWCLDDAGQDATALRREAAALWGDPADTETALRLVDVLRRAGTWDMALARADAAQAAGLDESSARILDFQRARIAARDAGRQLISSALRPPASKPHAAHGRTAMGWWQRLFRR